MIDATAAEKLRAAFCVGQTARAASRKAGVSESTAQNWFRRFRDAGVKRPHCGTRGWHDVPVYSGPDWIGKRIESDSAPRI